MARKPRTLPDGAPAPKPKRVRRKCSAPGCDNRVVQGGVCVTHGAKRKLCSHPGCDKAVKLAGFCSAHGPARKRCDHPGGCTRVAVQGGKCLSHGARRRVCSYPLKGRGGETCTKNAIVGGMCKKHYDRVQEASGMLELTQGGQQCLPVGHSPEMASSVSRSASASDGGEELSLGSSSSPSWTAGGGADLPPPPPPKVQVPPRTASRKPKKLAGHQRGLSIFDEMPTVDAIINSGAPKPPQPPVASSQAPVAPKAVPRAPVAPDVGTKTPSAQVSFADHPKPGCLGNASCTCDACRSPTLAIFEQMIQASHELERGDATDPRFAGLSPLKRKSSLNKGAAHPKDPTETPKNVSFLPEEPTSTGSVVRKVSSNNIVGEVPAGAAAGESPSGMEPGYTPLPHREYADEGTAAAALAEGPASHALAALARDDAVARTVSHDVLDPHQQHAPYHYGGGYGQYAQRHSPPEHHGHPQGRRTPPGYHPAPPGAPPPYGAYGPPPPGYPPHGGHPGYSAQRAAYHPPSAPQTPALYDQQPTAVVSAHSHHRPEGGPLLPRRREDRGLDHLFIPKEV